jgi:hypothetical protein
MDCIQNVIAELMKSAEMMDHRVDFQAGSETVHPLLQLLLVDKGSTRYLTFDHGIIRPVD